MLFGGEQRDLLLAVSHQQLGHVLAFVQPAFLALSLSSWRCRVFFRRNRSLVHAPEHHPRAC